MRKLGVKGKLGVKESVTVIEVAADRAVGKWDGFSGVKATGVALGLMTLRGGWCGARSSNKSNVRIGALRVGRTRNYELRALGRCKNGPVVCRLTA